MRRPEAEARPDDALPRLGHWLTAALILLATTLIVPLFAAFI